MKKFIIIVILICSSCSISSGSYPYAQRYEVNQSKSDLIESIDFFMDNNPQYKPKEIFDFEDINDTDHWDHFYFNDFENKRIFLTWVRFKSEAVSTFAVVSFIDYSVNVNYSWIRINKDLNKSDNKKVLEFFKKNILRKIAYNDFIDSDP